MSKTETIEVNFSSGKPPVYDRCVEEFGVDWNNGMIFTYGNTIHSKNLVSNQKIAHERTHVRQQTKYGVGAWWDKFFEDKKFRLSQELEAYKNEAKWIKENVKDRNKRSLLITKIARDLSGTMYDKMIDYNKAYKLLK